MLATGMLGNECLTQCENKKGLLIELTIILDKLSKGKLDSVTITLNRTELMQPMVLLVLYASVKDDVTVTSHQSFKDELAYIIV